MKSTKKASSSPAPEETELNKNAFADHLAQSIKDWNDRESLVIGLYGRWGSGKTSLLNLAKARLKRLDSENAITIFDFDPWRYAKHEKLLPHFFNEISKRVRKGFLNTIAGAVERSARVLEYVTPSEYTRNLLTAVFGLFAVLGFSNVLLNAGTESKGLGVFFIVFCAALFLATLGVPLARLMLHLFRRDDIFFENAKETIKKTLIRDHRKLVIAINDIDRLSPDEMLALFQLIKVNSDLPNTVFLLSYDKDVVENMLTRNSDIHDARDFLTKTIQVEFNVPFTNPEEIYDLLSREIARIAQRLPAHNRAQFETTGEQSLYLNSIFNSGIKYFFSNIHDIKRYANSLEFNIRQMYSGDALEANPIDFIALECFRVFYPEFYAYMKANKILFTAPLYEPKEGAKPSRISELSSVLERYENDGTKRRRLLDLLIAMFPLLIIPHNEEYERKAMEDLRICATDRFDRYFALFPGKGDDISQFELDTIIASFESLSGFKQTLRRYTENGNLNLALKKIKHRAYDASIIKHERVETIVQGLFDISDDFPSDTPTLWRAQNDVEAMRIIYRLLTRERNLSANMTLLTKTITNSEGLYGPVLRLSWNDVYGQESAEAEAIVREEDLAALQRLCAKKIRKREETLLSLKSFAFAFTLAQWRRWDTKEADAYIARIAETPALLIDFVAHFIVKVSRLQTTGLSFQLLSEIDWTLETYIDLDYINETFESIKKTDSALYEAKKDRVDFFLERHKARKTPEPEKR